MVIDDVVADDVKSTGCEDDRDVKKLEEFKDK